MARNGQILIFFQIEPTGFLDASDVEDGSVSFALSNQVYFTMNWDGAWRCL